MRLNDRSLKKVALNLTAGINDKDETWRAPASEPVRRASPGPRAWIAFSGVSR
jgi:hypothetical protein